MSLIKKKSDTTYILNIRVKPNSRAQKVRIDYDSNLIIISLVSKPLQNKANNELIQLLKKQLEIDSDQIRFISGLKGTYKVIQIKFKEKRKEEEIIKKLLKERNDSFN